MKISKNKFMGFAISDLFTYDPDTGVVRHNPKRPEESFTTKGKYNSWLKRLSGKPYSNKYANGYLQGSTTVLGKPLVIAPHRVAVILSGYEIPAGYEVDHVDGDRSNNKLINLRVVTKSKNRKNKRLYKKNKSGVSGVEPSGRGWKATIGIKGKPIYLGTFDTKEEAISVRRKAEVDNDYY